MKPAENMERRGKARLSFVSPISLKDFHLAIGLQGGF